MNGNFVPGATVFKLYAEKGLPLMFSVMLAHDKGYTVEWPGFFAEALRNGWTVKRTYAAIISAARDADIFTEKELEEFTNLARAFVGKAATS